MNIIRIHLTTIVIFFTLITSAQDLIVKNDKTEIKAKIIELTDDTIKYKKFEMLDGPIYNIKNSEVFMIFYKNGTKEYINKQPNGTGNSQSLNYNKSANDYNEEGVKMFKLKNYQEAKANFEKAIAINPKEAMYYFNRGVSMFRMNNFVDAFTDFHKANQMAPNNIRFEKVLVDDFTNKNYTTCIDDCNKFLQVEPNNAFVYFIRGRANNQLNNKDNFRIDTKIALEKDPNSLEALESMVLISVDDKNYEEVISFCERVLLYAPDEIKRRTVTGIDGMYYFIGSAKYELGDRDGSCAAWKQISNLETLGTIGLPQENINLIKRKCRNRW